MLRIQFEGWFQCRLATDPDPYDEPRGVSGYVHAYAGEPDLDRVIYWQPPVFSRSFAPRLGVAVSRVSLDGNVVELSPLVGATVNLHGLPKFEGHNGVISEDGFEPIYPFDLEISNENFLIRRAVVPYDDSYAFEGLLASGVDLQGAAEIHSATGIVDLREVWRGRLEALRKLSDLSEPERTATGERIRFLERNLSTPQSVARFFVARMNYNLLLSSESPSVSGVAEILEFDPEVFDPWRVQLWMGGWDADVLCGYARGTLSIPREAESIMGERVRMPKGVHRDLV